MLFIKYLLTISVGLILFCENINAQKESAQREWESISVLHSTCADVEKQFGKPTESSFTTKTTGFYELKNFNLLIVYSGKPCSDDNDYQIPVDTVRYFTVSLAPNNKISLSAVIRNKDDFEKTIYPPFIYYDSKIKGVVFEVFPENKLIRSIEYRPKKEDYKLQCLNSGKKK